MYKFNSIPINFLKQTKSNIVMPQIYFSLQEANELISKIKKNVDRITQLRDEIDLLDNTQIEFEDKSIEHMLLEIELNKSFYEKNLEMHTLIGNLIKQGCIIRELTTMEIDFYSRFNGKDIAFCWRPNEEKISHWHFLKEGCEKRQPIKIVERNYLEALKKLR